MNYKVYQDILACPSCKSDLKMAGDKFECENPACLFTFPVIAGIPVMMSPTNPLFNAEDFKFKDPTDVFSKQFNSPLIRLLKKAQPDLTLNNTSKINYHFIGNELTSLKQPRILIIGGSIDGKGIASLKENLPAGHILIESDITHGPNTSIIFDSHEIPFKNAVFDLVIVQAVLEHVLDPFKCVSEIYRVLKDNRFIYAETPFMQQVHGGQYDFHRFTALGHRRLFRNFVEIKSGVLAGAGSSLAWSLKYFITSFAPTKKIDKVLSYGASFLVFWLKYFDLLLNKTKGSQDAACAYFFLGRKSGDYLLQDKELLRQYKGYRY